VAVTARSRWTDERIDDLAAHVDANISALRADMREGFRDVREDIRELRETQRWMLGLHVTTLLGVVAIAVETIAH
jgi:hypothetical protein